MTNQNNPAQSAMQETVLTDLEIQETLGAIFVASHPYGRRGVLSQWEWEKAAARAIESALLSKLRAPVAPTTYKLTPVGNALTIHTDGSTARDPNTGPTVEGTASAPADPETAEVDFLVRVLENLDTWSAEEWSELLERRPAILAMLRPMVLAAFAKEDRNGSLISFAVGLADETLGESVTPQDYAAAGAFIERGRQARAALASAPVAGPSGETLRVAGVIADKIEDGTLFEAGIFSRRELADKVRAVVRFVQQGAGVAAYAAPQASEAQCSCPSGDGSLSWPCAKHPQATHHE